MSKPYTREALAYMLKVKQLGCAVCSKFDEHDMETGMTVCEAHHAIGLKYRAKGKKAEYYNTIPLCRKHHRLGGEGVAIHANLALWEENHSTQEYHLENTQRELSFSDA